MAYLSKYGVARKIRIPMVKRGVVDHAVSADWTPAAGDVKISKDGGAAANVTNLPTAIAMGNTAIWEYSLTATEMQAAQINITIADSATKAVEDSGFDIETYGNASGQHAVDLADSVRMGLTALPNAAAGANGGLPLSVDASGRVDVLKVNGTSQTAGDLYSKLSGLTFTVANQVDVNVVDWKGAAAAAMTGDAFARLGAPAGASVSADIAAIYARAGAPAGASMSADIAAILAATLNAAGVRAAVGLASANLDTQLGAIAGYIDTEIGTLQTTATAIKNKTDNLPAAPAAVGDIPTANQNADALLDRANGIETGFTVRQSGRLWNAVLAGKLSGAGTATETFRDVGDTKDRIVATVDVDGNRTAITRDAT